MIMLGRSTVLKTDGGLVVPSSNVLGGFNIFESSRSLQVVVFVQCPNYLLVLFFTGNGVVIHLPGLFEEAEKNERKGKGGSLSETICRFTRVGPHWAACPLSNF